MRHIYVRVLPPPMCPFHFRQPMRLKVPKKDEDWLPFWGCTLYPACKETRAAATKMELMPWDIPAQWKGVLVYD